MLEARNKALEKERVNIERLENKVTDLEGDAATNLVVHREMKAKMAKLEKELEELKKKGLGNEAKEEESEEEGEWKEGLKAIIVVIVTHEVPEKRRLKDVEAEKWTGLFRYV